MCENTVQLLILNYCFTEINNFDTQGNVTVFVIENF